MADRVAIREFLQALLRNIDDTEGFSDSDSLIASGRLQSIDTLEVVLFLEENYAIDFAERGFDLNELDSVDAIMTLLGN